MSTCTIRGRARLKSINPYKISSYKYRHRCSIFLKTNIGQRSGKTSAAAFCNEAVDSAIIIRPQGRRII